MNDLLLYLLNAITGDSSAELETTEEDNVVNIAVNLPEEQRPRVIGKRGMNIKSIRNLVSIIARREGKRVYIKIVD